MPDLEQRITRELRFGRHAADVYLDQADIYFSKGDTAQAQRLWDLAEEATADGESPTLHRCARNMRALIDPETTPLRSKWAEREDPRRTRVGRIIRAWSLDELPQLFNVVLGDMSIVGPRPERPQFVQQFRAEFPHYMLRHKVRAGMTGWAQVHGWRGNTSVRMRIEHDLYYIENWSLMLDVKILFMTVLHGLRHENAY